MKKELKPRSIMTLSADKAWMYVNNGSIDVFVSENGKDALSCRITKRQLMSILGAEVFNL